MQVLPENFNTFLEAGGVGVMLDGHVINFEMFDLLATDFHRSLFGGAA